MAPRKPVESLYNLCVESVLKDVRKRKLCEDCNVLRKHLISYLPGTVRSYVVDKAVAKYSVNVRELSDLVALFGDQTTKRLNISEHYHMSSYESKNLFTIIDNSDIIGLHELDIKVYGNETMQEEDGLSAIHRALTRGLASTLRILTLHNCADNTTLKLIGRYALHLTHLEITCSWKVDDLGISDLIFKDSSSVITLPWAELEDREPTAIHQLSLIPKNELNRTCDTLCEVRIQDTNTSTISVILLLVFAKNLKSFGGFLYDRNIGDTVLSVQARENAPECLSLTELWDMDLPSTKQGTLLKFLPNLSHLYTRSFWLTELAHFPPALTHLTADFDFVHPGFQLFNFLGHAGGSIRKLILIDQVYGFDLAMIAIGCPLLEELSAKVYVEDPTETACGLLSHLKFAEVRITTPGTFSWIMRQADNIKRFEALLEHEEGVNVMFDNQVITKLLEEKPKSLESITRLGIHLAWRTIFEGIVLSCGTLAVDIAYKLIEACPSLKMLGELETWIQVSLEHVQEMAEYIIKSNLDLRVRYKNKVYPNIT